MSDVKIETIEAILRTNGRDVYTNEARDMAAEIKRRRAGGDGSEDRPWIAVPKVKPPIGCPAGYVPGLSPQRLEVWSTAHNAADYAVYSPIYGWSLPEVTHYRAMPKGPAT